MKQRSLIFLAAAMALVFVLAISVTGMPLLPGQSFVLRARNLPFGGGGGLGSGETFLLILRIMLALSLVALPVYIITSILTKEGRRRLLGNVISVLALVLLINLLQRSGLHLPDLAQQRSEGQTQTSAQARNEPEPEPPAPPPDWLVFAATAGISLIVVALAAGLFFAARQRPAQLDALQELGDDAQEAIDALRAGDALGETIQRCYHNMCDVLAKERNLARGSAMTPSEFEQLLGGKGLPRGPVHTLTSLFEQIRYGGITASAREQAMAIESLQAIVAACAQNRAQSQAGQPTAA